MHTLESMVAKIAGHLVSANRIAALAKWIFLQELLGELRIEDVLDVGANIGQFASSIRAIGFRGTILSFEPIPEVFATLARTMAHDQNWSAHNVALGETEEVREFNIMRSTVYSSFSKPVDDPDGCNRIMRTCPVQVRRLDHILGERNLERTLLKVDTQGHEMQVFHGLGDKLASVRAVLCEVSANALYEGTPPMHEVIAFLEKSGFKSAFFAPLGRRHDLSAQEFDYCCVRAIHGNS